MVRFLLLGLTTFFLAVTTDCSSINRRQDTSDKKQSDGPKATTPLDMPKENAPAADTEIKKEPTPFATGTDESDAIAPTVTLVKKDGTPVTPSATSTVAAKDTAAAKETPMPLAVTPDKAEWDYSSEHGPDHWAELKPEFSLCRDGKSQSPIDLKWHRPGKNGPLALGYKLTQGTVKDEGHGIEVSLESNSQVKFDGHVYDLMQVHFHTPAEHTLSGKAHPMEIHFVHKDADGKTLVIAAFVKEGGENKIINRIWNGLRGGTSSEGGTVAFNPEHLLPTAKTYYHYMGSLTVPPCAEGVTWVVYNSAITASADQIKAIQGLHGDNARPRQPLSGRPVKNF